MTNAADFYLTKTEPNKSCLLALQGIILNLDPGVQETVKYGMPCFVYDRKPLFYLWVDKKTGEPYVLFVDGKLMNHPNLEQGDRSQMKILRINPNEDLPADLLPLLVEALELKRM